MENNKQDQNLNSNNLTTNNEKEKNNNSWKFFLLILSIGILVYSFFYSDNIFFSPPLILPKLMGYFLPLAIIFWLIFYLLFIRKKITNRSKIGFFVFIIIYISFIISGYISFAINKMDAQKAITGIQEEYNKLVSNTSQSRDSLSPKQDTAIKQVSSQSSGMFGEMEKFIKNYMNSSASLGNNYQLELNDIGWHNILNFERIKNDKDFEQTKNIISEAKNILKKYKEKTKNLFVEAYNEIDNLNIEEEYKEIMEQGFKQGMKTSENYLNKGWDLEEKTINEVEKILILLSSNRELWTTENNQILFYDEECLEKYNSHIGNIHEIIIEQQTISQKSMEEAKNSLEKINKSLDNI